MANYKLSPAAEDDLYQIWLYGLKVWGEDAADQYVRGWLVSDATTQSVGARSLTARS